MFGAVALLLSLASCSDPTVIADAGPGSLDARPAIDAAPRIDARPPTPDARPPVPDAPPDAPVIDAPPDAPPPIVHRDVRCGDPVPPGSARPAPLAAYSGGTCPALVPGLNTISSSGASRSFLVVVPSDLRPDEHLPVLFMWHWLQGSADGFLARGNVQQAADELRLIAVIPEAKGDVTIDVVFDEIHMVWPYLTSSTEARVQEELTFFDDMLACVSAQYAPDLDCVSSIGVSAGGLWTSQLLQHRSDVLASALVLSGGVGPASGTTFLDVAPWRDADPPRAVPSLVLWGGPMDSCAINFERASENLEDELGRLGGFVLECVHDCGHDVPPVEDEMLGIAALYRFAIDHPFWLARGESPYHVRGLPTGMPEWCTIGAGAATPRSGMCDPDGPACDFPSL